MMTAPFFGLNCRMLSAFSTALAADQVGDEPPFLGREAHAAQFCSGVHVVSSRLARLPASGLAFLSAAARAEPAFEWPLKMRVCANSPSLWPTMFSVMYTGTCCLPLCTAIVSPTKSGRIVERRDHVLIGRLSDVRARRFHLVQQVVIDERALLD